MVNAESCTHTLLRVNLSVCVRADIFSQVSDSSGALVHSKFDGFLREALKVPTAVHEGPSFGYTYTAASSCFPQQVPTRLHN